MPSPLKIGDRVRLTVDACRQLDWPTRNRVVTTVMHVETESMTEPEETFQVQVHDPEINRLFLFDRMLEKVL